ncbi:hypothetical protein ACQU0X_25560 [Pseudovibrio ascidiaceicola]|uniref:hypothetical protein n=1 Tax=Pseudovibrio ascidiaceicola TaxID=285279 RepID=UPI003D35EB14
MFTHSVVSYPDRGTHGDNKYRGNCTGYIVRDFVKTYMKHEKALFADPSIGGGTSQDVAQELGVRFKGTDLRDGFNLLTDSFGEFLGEEAQTIWWHPPYWDMIKYSGNQWGEANKWDLSQMGLNDFVESLEVALMNIHDATEKGGHYGILMGNLRRKGQYFNLSSLVERVAPAPLVDEIIKTQHNCVSDGRSYARNIVRIAHEKLLVFRRGNAGSLQFLMVAHNRAGSLIGTTWRAAIRRTMQGKTMSLAQLYEALKSYATTRENSHWQAQIRKIVQDDRYFVRVSKGVYKLAT